MENNMVGFLRRAAEQSGFHREYYLEKNIPTLSSNIYVLPFFGDLRSTFILSSFLLRPFKEHLGKYLILCSWPGFQGLFPYVDEFWSIKDKFMAENLASATSDFQNNSDTATNYTRNLIQHFENVLSFDKDFANLYRNGFESKYFDTYHEVKKYLPEVPSVTQMGGLMQSNSRKRILIYPVKHIRSWQRGSVEYLLSPKDFWVELTKRLLDDGFYPTVYQNIFTYDLSPDFTDKCDYLTAKNISQVLSVMHEIGLVLDIHSGISRLAYAARTPFLCVDERLRFVNQKEYEIDDLCGDDIFRKYIMSFATMLLTGGPKEWGIDILDQLIIQLKDFQARSSVSTKELYEVVDYNRVRKWKARRLGANFISKKY